MKLFLRWAGPFLILAALFDGFSAQLFSANMANLSITNRFAFVLGVLIGDLPAIAGISVVVLGLCWLRFKAISLRLFLTFVGIGCFISAIVVRPLLIAYLGRR